MRKLEIDGLVKYLPHKGTVVTAVEKEEIKYIYEIRKVVEGLIVKKSAENITDDLIIEMKINSDRFRVAIYNKI